MKDDNTPTVTARTRKLIPHMRLRLEKAKTIQGIGARAKAKRAALKKQKADDGDLRESTETVQNFPNLKKNTLNEPPVPPPKFKKRQICKSWLPTHLFHAKRAHMTPPKEPLWRFAIPMTPTAKSYRATHRAGSMRGCIAWDTSYMSTIGIEGVQGSLIGLLRCLGVPEDQLVSQKGSKWRIGTRFWNGWMRERDATDVWVAKVQVVWCAAGDQESTTDRGQAVAQPSSASQRHTADQEQAIDRDEGMDQGQTVDQELASDNRDAIDHIKAADRIRVADRDQAASKKAKEKVKRRILLRVHPSGFLQLWNDVLKVAKMQRPPAMVEDLRFEIGSIEVMGPGATETLVAALQPMVNKTNGVKSADSIGRLWTSLSAVTNPASLPANAMLGFNVSDPRLHHPPRTTAPSHSAGSDELLQILSSWPPDDLHTPQSLFDRDARLKASRSLPSQKSINRRKGDALPGQYPSALPADPHIPVLLLASRLGNTTVGQGSWTILLPWKCVLPVWYSLMYYPLSSGGTPRFGGLREIRQVSFEQDVPWFPGDFPGTKAGMDWELREREKRKADWEKRPKGRKIEWDKVDLGDGRKGEIGRGWACDWERLFEGPDIPLSALGDNANNLEISGHGEVLNSAKKLDLAKQSKVPEAAGAARGLEAAKNTKASKGSQEAPAPQAPRDRTIPKVPATSKKAEDTRTPSYDLRQIPLSHLPSISGSPSPRTLITVAITLLHRGSPTTCARIYRLPTFNPSLRSAWLQQIPPGHNKSTKHSHPKASRSISKKPTHPHEFRASLASSLLHPDPTTLDLASDGILQAGHPDYPIVPGEDDLIGFVTTGNYNLGEGRGTAIGCVALARVIGEVKSGGKGGLCIVREAGMGVGRIARWRLV